MRTSLILYVLLGVLTVATAFEPKITKEQTHFFRSKIEPALKKYCYECHSRKSKKLKADFYLDSRAGILHGGESEMSAVDLKNPEKSIFLEAIRHEGDLEMP